MLQAKILKRILLLTWKLCFWLPESLTNDFTNRFCFQPRLLVRGKQKLKECGKLKEKFLRCLHQIVRSFFILIRIFSIIFQVVASLRIISFNDFWKFPPLRVYVHVIAGNAFWKILACYIIGWKAYWWYDVYLYDLMPNKKAQH